jgi:TetR/AcrR family transcriptional repressor of mexJK operon
LSRALNVSTRAKITEAAKACFLSNGYHETTIRTIAEKAGISPGSIYKYFPGKKELFNSLNIPQMAAKRPEQEKKRAEILRAALVLFGENGFAGTNMDEIANAVGVSKATLYLFCDSKEDLLVQVLQESTFNILSKNINVEHDDEHWEEAIKKVGCSYLEIAHQPDRVALLRTVIRESAKHPEIGALYYKKGFKAACLNVVDYLKRLRKLGIIKMNDGDIMMAVHIYFGSLQSFVLMNSTIVGISLDITLEDYLDSSTDIFLNGLKRHMI